MIPLHTIVASLRAHEPTRDLLPPEEWFWYSPEGKWYIGLGVPADEKRHARLIVEVCLWRAYHDPYRVIPVEKDEDWYPLIIAQNDYAENGELQWAVKRDITGAPWTFFGTDICAALCFALGIPMVETT